MKMKKLSAVILAIGMMFAMSVSVFAHHAPYVCPNGNDACVKGGACINDGKCISHDGCVKNGECLYDIECPHYEAHKKSDTKSYSGGNNSRHHTEQGSRRGHHGGSHC